MNNFKVENVKLLNAVTYQDENGTWCMELKYEYEDDSGIHIKYYPKVEFPSIPLLKILAELEILKENSNEY